MEIHKQRRVRQSFLRKYCHFPVDVESNILWEYNEAGSGKNATESVKEDYEKTKLFPLTFANGFFERIVRWEM